MSCYQKLAETAYDMLYPLGGAVIGGCYYGYHNWSTNRTIYDDKVRADTLKKYIMTGFFFGGACRIAMVLPADLRRFLRK